MYNYHFFIYFCNRINKKRKEKEVSIIKRWTLASMLLLMTGVAYAQKLTVRSTMFLQNKPATVALTDGRTLKVSNANVFLKNAALLYFQGEQAKEARMDNVLGVQFDDRSFINIDNRLAYFVDSIKGNGLYCVETIDIDDYERNLKNNVNFTHIDLSHDHLDTATTGFENAEEVPYPVNRQFYYRLDGKFVLADPRELNHTLSKKRSRIMRTITNVPDFNWSDTECLMRLLGLISD